MILDACLDALLDTAKTLPFLFAAFLALEALEHYSNDGLKRLLGKMGKAGPLAGAVFGCIPQCGFSVAAVNLYSGGVITLGTLLAVFLATSDEALLILLAHPGSAPVMVRLLLGKIVIGAAAGFLADLLRGHRMKEKHIEDMCRERGCGCSDDNGILRPALRHTVSLTLYIFVFTCLLNILLSWIGMDRLSAILGRGTLLQPVLAALLGLIPNCASSILITELYLAGGLDFGAAMAGLCAGAGVGMAVLFRENRPWKENFLILGLLYAVSVAVGLVL